MTRPIASLRMTVARLARQKQRARTAGSPRFYEIAKQHKQAKEELARALVARQERDA